MLKRGVEIRINYAKEPGPVFREDFYRYRILQTGLERMLCPRVHFKMLIFAFETAYIGSANLTGSDIGMTSSNRRAASSSTTRHCSKQLQSNSTANTAPATSAANTAPAPSNDYCQQIIECFKYKKLTLVKIPGYMLTASFKGTLQNSGDSILF